MKLVFEAHMELSYGVNLIGIGVERWGETKKPEASFGVNVASGLMGAHERL